MSTRSRRQLHQLSLPVMKIKLSFVHLTFHLCLLCLSTCFLLLLPSDTRVLCCRNLKVMKCTICDLGIFRLNNLFLKSLFTLQNKSFHHVVKKNSYIRCSSKNHSCFRGTQPSTAKTTALNIRPLQFDLTRTSVINIVELSLKL